MLRRALMQGPEPTSAGKTVPGCRTVPNEGSSRTPPGLGSPSPASAARAFWGTLPPARRVQAVECKPSRSKPSRSMPSRKQVGGMDRHDRVEQRLAEVPLFAGLSKKELRTVAHLATYLEEPAG